MKRTSCVVLFGLTLSLAYAQEESKRGLSRQSAAGQPTAAPAVPSTSNPDRSDPSVDAVLSSGASVLPDAATASDAVFVDPALQTQIQDALTKDPIFSNSHLKVMVRADTIELSGDVANGRDRQNAARMAQSYARGKKVINYVVVRRQGEQPAAKSPESPPVQPNMPAVNPAAAQSNPP